MRMHRAILFGLGLSLLAGSSAMATVVTGCSGGLTYDSGNGNSALPGYYVGIVGPNTNQYCQIGNLSDSNQGMAQINGTQKTSVYEFYFGGGALTITEKIGNNGVLPNTTIYAKLFSLDDIGSTSGTQIGAALPFYYISGGGPVGPETLFDGYLDAGYYSVLTTADVNEDPRFQMNFAFTSTKPAPEPATLTLLGAGLAGLGLRRRSKKSA